MERKKLQFFPSLTNSVSLFCLFFIHYNVNKNNILYFSGGQTRANMEIAEKISITTKTLASGNCQVKFFIKDETKPQYGYLLVTEPKQVGEIIDEIKDRIERRRISVLNMSSFSKESPLCEDHNFYLFSA